MSNKIKITIFLVVFIPSLIFVMIYSIHTREISMNPTGTVGNTAGNLYNNGLFCEYNGIVYFSNPREDGALYSMTPDEQNITKLTEGYVQTILAGGDYLYFFHRTLTNATGLGSIRKPHTYNRATLDLDNITVLTTDVVVNAQLVDNYLYLLTAGSPTPLFYKFKIDRSEKVDLANYEINPASVKNGTIYYNGTQSNHYLYALDTNTNTSSEFWQGNLWYPIYEGDYIYYLDVENNYRLCRYNPSMNLVEILTEDRIDCYNIGGGYIYYQKNSTTQPELKMMRLDGSEVTTLAEGIYTNINLTSRYVYFQTYGVDYSLYHAPIGSSTYSSMWSNP